MFSNLKARVALIGLLTALSLFFLYRNYNRPNGKGEPSRQVVTLGLDLQGGSHFALELDESRSRLSDAQRKDAIDRALKVVRMRVDELGVSEPVVQKVGNDRIIVELAGLGDQSRAKDVLQKTAFLEFRIVRPITELQPALPAIERAIVQAFPQTAGAKPAENAGVGGLLRTAEDSAKQNAQDTLSAWRPLESKFAGAGGGGQILVAVADTQAVRSYLENPSVKALMPRGTTFLWGVPAVEENPGFRSLWFAAESPIMTGEYLEDAQAQSDQFGRPIVTFQLDRRGGRRFEKATGEHLNEQMAIVLDQRVYTAPVIRGAINTNGQIELGKATLEEASDLALVLRAGALPAPLKIAEERSVGPSLGQDSIDKGKIAGIVGVALVVLMMIGIYHLSGAFAIGALVIYVVLVLGGLAALDATLTFPGIAGLILSIGMAVDANVLIFERIREELDNKRGVRAAINEGFVHALPAIVDSNVTTLITCAILFYTGTGPIRGFAVTLAIGIMASMFTAIFVTRTVFMAYLQRRPAAQTLSI